MIKKTKIFVTLFITSSLIVSCDKTEEEFLEKEIIKEKPIIPSIEEPVEKVDSVKLPIILNKLYGTWSMSRDDSGMPIITTFEIKRDSTYSYTQEIQEKSPYTLSLSGRWTYDLKKNEISFIFTDSISEGLNLNATLDEKQSSFIIADEYSAMDENKFTK